MADGLVLESMLARAHADEEGYPVLRPSFDSFTTAPSDMDLPQPGPATALNGAIIALQVLLNEAPNTVSGPAVEGCGPLPGALLWRRPGMPCRRVRLRFEDPLPCEGSWCKHPEDRLSLVQSRAFFAPWKMPPSQRTETCDDAEELPEEVRFPRQDERSNLQQQLKSLTEELESAQALAVGVAQIRSEDVSKEIALLKCFKDVALARKKDLFSSGAMTPDHQAVASHVPDLLVAPDDDHPTKLEVNESF
ncbi:unnamed protein product [Durusdinium trenchii]|uniref:Uncharacterized protein n=1 Tax=Durusdinium trenchii TaxID=1381693 RepID=A0ABP0Q567_9DINO